MPIITISRGSFSGGKMLAECLAARLGYRSINRDALVAGAAAFGVTEDDVRRTLEQPPSFWDRFTHTRYAYLAVVQAALAEQVRSGRVVYHGLAGHLLLQGVRHVLRTRLVAPLEFRIRALQARLQLDREHAISHIQKVDQDRQRWTQFLYGVNWGDPALYDVVVNLEHLTVEEACDIVSHAAGLACYQESPESVAAIRSLALASAVRAKLVMAPGTSDLEVAVAAEDGVVTIWLRVQDRDRRPEVEREVAGVAGLTRLKFEELVSPIDVMVARPPGGA